MNTGVKGNGSGTRNSEQRADSQRAENGNGAGIQGMHRHSNGVRVIALLHSHSEYTQQREADTAKAEAEHAPADVVACHLSQNRREN